MIRPPPISTLFPYTTLFRSPDYKALVGDASDNIPGVPGVGQKTATILLQRFGSIESLIERIEEVDRKSTRLNSSHSQISYAVFCLKKKKKKKKRTIAKNNRS